ncbi:MAG TPA: flavodoxin family protein [Victivallales bacterium]|nr:flavodoxin family protein [Victivallales bacterium]
MKAVIVFHSVCGNTYLLAKEFYNSLTELGFETSIYRVKDDDIKDLSEAYPCAKEFYNKITSIPEAKPEHVLESDLIIYGSPNYCSNVSAEMKTFIDSTCIYYKDSLLEDKYFTCFATGEDRESGIDICLSNMINYALGQCMQVIPIPTKLKYEYSIPSCGITHNSGPMADQRPNDKTYKGIQEYCKYIAEKLVLANP